MPVAQPPHPEGASLCRGLGCAAPRLQDVQFVNRVINPRDVHGGGGAGSQAPVRLGTRSFCLFPQGHHEMLGAGSMAALGWGDQRTQEVPCEAATPLSTLGLPEGQQRQASQE